MSERRSFSIGDRVKILTGKDKNNIGIIISDIVTNRGFITCEIQLENGNTIRFKGRPSDLELVAESMAVTGPVASTTSMKAASSAPQGDICSMLGSNQNSAEYTAGDLVQVRSPKGVWNDAILVKTSPKGFSVKDKNGMENQCTFSPDSIRKQDLFRCVAIGETQQEQRDNQVICSKKDGQVSSVLPSITMDFINFFENKSNKLTPETNELLGNLRKMMGSSDKLSLGTSRESLDTPQKNVYKYEYIHNYHRSYTVTIPEDNNTHHDLHHKIFHHNLLDTNLFFYYNLF